MALARREIEKEFGLGKVKKWEKEHKNSSDNSNEGGSKNGNNAAEGNSELSELLKRMGTIEDLLAKQRLAETISSKKKQLKKKLGHIKIQSI